MLPSAEIEKKRIIENIGRAFRKLAQKLRNKRWMFLVSYVYNGFQIKH